MANHDVSNPTFTKDIRKFEVTDPAHADVFNEVVNKLINNEVVLKNKQDKFSEDEQGNLTYNNKKVGETEAAKITIANIEGSEASNVQEALNEVFQSANNFALYKTDIANVVGLPMTKELNNDAARQVIENIKSTFVSNLQSKGVSSNESKSLTELVSDIENITIVGMEGILKASGTASVDTEASTANRAYVSTISFPFEHVLFFACSGSITGYNSPGCTGSSAKHNMFAIYSEHISKLVNYSYQSNLESNTWDPTHIAIGDTNVSESFRGSISWYAAGY